MISKLPAWVWIGAWLLAFVAGIINAVGLLGFDHQTITHLTGNTSFFSMAVASGNPGRALFFMGLIGTFLLGTILSGLVIRDSPLELGGRYGVALLIEASLLSISIPFFEHHSIFGMYLISTACGLQNAMMSTYSGSIVRTTHLSGMFTDFGIFCGCALRGIPVDKRRLHLSLTVISAFVCGGIAGAFSYHFMGYGTLFIPSAITGMMAAVYWWYRKRSG